MEEEEEESGTGSDVEGQIASRSKKFAPAVLASLGAFFENGMVGVGEQYHSAIQRSAQDTKLSSDQIKVIGVATM